MSLTVDKLKEQLNKLLAVREQYAQAFQQTVGQINLIQSQIKMLLNNDNTNKESDQETKQEPEGDSNAAQEGNE